MNNLAAYRDKKGLVERLAAFSLFLEEGMDAVKRMYPQHLSFVESHIGKSQAEVKKELLQSLPA
ncbi:MAG: hypothetical protein JST68_31045 [Bacteroidetes bacterium]|nr:hypothetical protein [Bacteroidota bacterium]